jgi:hypothetical protein
MKISTKMMKGTLGFIGALCLLAPPMVFAQDDLMLMMVPALSGNRPLRNVITVAKGNGKFTDPVAAVNSITDASATNPYLVVIGPGVYTVTSPVVMKPYVDIAGSGENVPKITGAFTSPTSGTVCGANNSALSSLTVENTGGVGVSTALYNNNVNVSARVNNVTAKASGGTSANVGVYNFQSSSPVMTLVNVVVSGGAGATNNGVLNNYYSSPVMTLVNVVVTGGTETYGVINVLYSSPVMTDIHIIASGGTSNYGVSNNSISSPVMTNVHALAFGGTKSYGVWNDSSSSPMIRRSTMNGGTNGLFTDTYGTATVSQSTILNGVSGSGTKSCVACDNGSGGALNQFTCN